MTKIQKIANIFPGFCFAFLRGTGRRSATHRGRLVGEGNRPQNLQVVFEISARRTADSQIPWLTGFPRGAQATVLPRRTPSRLGGNKYAAQPTLRFCSSICAAVDHVRISISLLEQPALRQGYNRLPQRLVPKPPPLPSGYPQAPQRPQFRKTICGWAAE